MKDPRPTRPLLSLVLLLVAVLACNVPGIVSRGNIEATATMGTLETTVVEAMSTDEGDQTDQSPESTPTNTLVPSEPTRTAIVHEMRPEEPVALLSQLTDLSSQPFADEHRAIGDSFMLNLYERPFTAETMDYLPHLDVVYAELGLSMPWIYVVIHLQEAPPSNATAIYGVEIDLDLDGRGDWLIMATPPPSSEWTTDGVSAARDTNDDVGGPTPLRPDVPDQERDGYDERVFYNGLGSDPDAAWVRRDPENPERIQIAFKYELIDSEAEFLWGAWSDASVKKPIWFDYHDHFTIEQAGDPSITSDEYPLKALARLDNTCRWAFGFTPVGNEPGLCGSTSQSTPEPNMGYLVCTGGIVAAPVCECRPTCERGDTPCTPCELP